jgi:pyruvate dehydrogenase E2 component (dihydrolipoamide acetyltransferase)
MPFTLTMPKLSPTMEEGTIIKWLKKEGEFVDAGDILLEVTTDKATVEFEAIDEGWLQKIIVKENESAILNQAIAIMTEDQKESIEGYTPEGISIVKKETTETSTTTSVESAQLSTSTAKGISQPAFEPTPSLENYTFPFPRQPLEDRLAVSPLARKLAKEQNIDLTTIKGSGPGNRIVKADLNKGQPDTVVSFDRREIPSKKPGEYQEKPLTPMRKSIGRRLQESKTFIPHWYVKQKIDAQPMMQLRTQLKEWGIKLTFNDFILRATALALKKHPQVNAGYNSVNESVVYYQTIDISIAVSLDDGLITPIVRYADFKSLGELSLEVKELAIKARSGKLEPHEYQGGSFTLSNLGMYGITEFQAIINPPQSAILAIGAIETTPVVKEDCVVPGHQLTLSLSSDHRIIDGAIGADFMRTLKKYLTNPAGLCV